MTTEAVIADNVRFHRARLKLSQVCLAEQAGISQSYVTKIEAGNGNVTVEILDRLALALGVSAEVLVTPGPESTDQAA